MVNKAPAFQFYAADYLADENVQLMSLEEEGAYIRLTAYCWREGSVPADPVLLSRLCKGAPAKVIEVVARCFSRSKETGRLIHPRLEAERKKQAEFRRKMSDAGREGNAKRWGGDRVGDGKVIASDRSASASSSSKPSRPEGRARRPGVVYVPLKGAEKV